MAGFNKVTLLKNLSLGAALWSLIYAICQLILLGLSLNNLNQQRLRQENMEVASYGGGVDPYRNSMPGLYQRYMDMPERRRITALFVLHITLLVLTVIHGLLSMLLVYGIIMNNKHGIWPWIPSALIISLISMSYSIVWFTGDCFRWWLAIAWFEFLTAIPINAIFIGIVLIYLLMTMDYFTDDNSRPNGSQGYYDGKPPYWQEQPQQPPQYYAPTPVQAYTPIQQPTPQPYIQQPPQSYAPTPQPQQYVPVQHYNPSPVPVQFTQQPPPIQMTPIQQPDIVYKGVDKTLLEKPPREHCPFCTPTGLRSRSPVPPQEQQPLFHDNHHHQHHIEHNTQQWQHTHITST